MLICAGVGACASPSPGAGASSGRLSAEEATPARVTLMQYRDSMRLNLVNEAHTDPVEYYSDVRSDASTKITSNEYLRAMLDYFDEQGFSKYAQAGYAPRQGSPGELQALEVETEDGVHFLLYDKHATKPALETFVQCVMAWQEVYNRTLQAQAMTNSGRDVRFEKPATRGKQNR
jgi:hypothetical protein